MFKLPADCDLFYDETFLSATEADALYSELDTEFNLTNRTITLADGSLFEMDTGCYLFTDSELTSTDKLPAAWGERSPWTESLQKVRDRIESITDSKFHVARCVLYRDGTEGIDYHQDLPAYGSTDVIASLSLGTERTFSLRCAITHQEQLSLRMPHGSLLIMGKGCQQHYEHAVPCEPDCQKPRLNITFRRFGY